MTVYKAPHKIDYYDTYIAPKLSVFLAGSIEMGVAEDWQNKAIKLLDPSYHIYNPRRDDWDNSWGPESPELIEQINWELDSIEKSNYVLFYFDPNTKSPISLLELGLCLEYRKSLVVCCTKEFYRYTNVKVTLDRYGLSPVDTLEEAVDQLPYLKFGM